MPRPLLLAVTTERSSYAHRMANYMDASSVSEVLKSAATAVELAGLPPELREEGFRAAVKLLAGPQSPSSTPPVSAGLGPPPSADDNSTESGGGSLAAVAAALQIPEDRVRLLFDDVDGHLQFCGDVAAFGASRTSKVKGIALLLLAARQSGGYDSERTEDARIRDEIQRLRIYDRSNYVKQVRAAFKGSVAITGSSRDLSYRIHDTGVRAAIELAAKLLDD